MGKQDWHHIWALDFQIQEDGSVTHYPHTIKIYGKWDSVHSYQNMIDWCNSQLGSNNQSWRAYRSYCCAWMIFQFTQKPDADAFSITWS